jgi:hypothetical protein
VIKGDGKKTGNYNAFLLQFLMNTVVSQSRVITSNLEKLLTFMSNTFVLKKLLYIEDVKDTNGVITSNFILNTMDILN